MTYVVVTPIGDGQRLVGPFKSFGDGQRFALEVGLNSDGSSVRLLASPELARAMLESLETSIHKQQEES